MTLQFRFKKGARVHDISSMNIPASVPGGVQVCTEVFMIEPVPVQITVNVAHGRRRRRTTHNTFRTESYKFRAEWRSSLVW